MLNQKYIVEDVNGIDLLFQLPSAYVAGTLRIIEKKVTNIEDTIPFTPMGAVFFKIDPPPDIGSDLICYYESTEEVALGLDGLNEWEKANIEKIMATVAFQTQAIDNLIEALDNRVSRREFDAHAAITNKEISDIKISLLSS